MSRTAHLLYDADCGFCRWSLGWVLRWDREQRLDPVALQDPRSDRLLASVPAAERMRSWHLVDADGTVQSAGAAAPPLLRMLPAGAPVAWVFERAPSAVAAAYRRVSGARGRLGPRIPRGSVARADRVIAERQAARAGTGPA